MQDAGARLMALPQLGVDVFGRGAPENLSARFRSVYGVTLYDLLRAYGDHRLREQGQTLRIAATDLYAVEDAIERLRGLVGQVPEWRHLFSFLPAFLRGSPVPRSEVASTFVGRVGERRGGEGWVW